MNNEIYKNLLVLLKLFQNRTSHLSDFLIENDALKSEFIEKINNNSKLSEMTLSDIKDNHLHFNSINEMKDYYKSLVDDLENLKNKKTKEEFIIELNDKLSKAIDNENYEEAVRIRDYMKLNNINKNI